MSSMGYRRPPVVNPMPATRHIVEWMTVLPTSQSQPHDAELVRGAWSGDEASLGLLLDRHRAAMHAVALHVLGNGTDAQDAVQDSVLTAMSKISGLRDPAAVGGWLRAITRNCCLMQLHARREVPLPEGLPLVSAELTPEAIIDRRALRDRVWHAIGELSPALRLTIVLRYFSDVSSYEQIAAACEVPIGTVRSRLNQARGKLASALEATADQAHADAGRLAGWPQSVAPRGSNCWGRRARIFLERTGQPVGGQPGVHHKRRRPRRPEPHDRLDEQGTLGRYASIWTTPSRVGT
jgi:RNA polymerase sigma factor (sigma-70 family)